MGHFKDTHTALEFLESLPSWYVLGLLCLFLASPLTLPGPQGHQARFYAGTFPKICAQKVSVDSFYHQLGNKCPGICVYLHTVIFFYTYTIPASLKKFLNLILFLIEKNNTHTKKCMYHKNIQLYDWSESKALCVYQSGKETTLPAR
jgi:hypothetical protein